MTERISILEDPTNMRPIKAGDIFKDGPDFYLLCTISSNQLVLANLDGDSYYGEPRTLSGQAETIHYANMTRVTEPIKIIPQD